MRVYKRIKLLPLFFLLLRSTGVVAGTGAGAGAGANSLMLAPFWVVHKGKRTAKVVRVI